MATTGRPKQVIYWSNFVIRRRRRRGRRRRRRRNRRRGNGRRCRTSARSLTG